MKDILRGLFLALFFHAAFAFAAPATADASTTPASACTEHYDIVIGVSDKDKLELALSNAQNLQAELGAACANIEIVNFSAAVTLLGPMSPKATLLKDAILHGVKIIACQNSMNKFKMTEDDLLPGITTVPSGAAEIVKRQKQGWTYLRP
ncbi:DsrE family protein [Herbaspirillum sp. RV1423]|uniref:DsrE family protein n=1 Tax=Herbaspirillum sp. RV1423 TaxID=1443993 RepID=UPI0006860FE9|nr:DsrE family protein [Herbaspirillum sp. RV1423]